MPIEFFVWNEEQMISGPHRKRSVAERSAEAARNTCQETLCGTDGKEEVPLSGIFACGVLSPHGVHVVIIQDGENVTRDDCGQFD